MNQGWGSEFDRLAEQLWSMMHEMTGRSYFCSHTPHTWRPHVNLYETPEQFIVCVELAGMPREEIDVRAVDRTLHIRGFRNKPQLPSGGAGVSVHLMEIDSGRFHRKVPIPEGVRTDAIQAVYRAGYLWVTMPKEGAHPVGE